MKIEEMQVVIVNQVPVIIYRSGSKYFMQDHSNIDMPLREIEQETAWDYLNVTEAMRTILKQFKK